MFVPVSAFWLHKDYTRGGKLKVRCKQKSLKGDEDTPLKRGQHFGGPARGVSGEKIGGGGGAFRELKDERDKTRSRKKAKRVVDLQ